MKLLSLSGVFTLTGLLLSNTVLAESYQSFSSISYHQANSHYEDVNKYSIATQYFFAGRTTTGPLNEFDYLNKLNNLSASFTTKQSDYAYYYSGYADNERDEDLSSLAAELFIGKFKVSAHYNKYDSQWNTHRQLPHYYSDRFLSEEIDITTVGFGYLLSDDFLLESSYFKVSEQDEIFLFHARYNLSFGENNYLGFDYITDEHLDSHALSAKLFLMFANKSYFVVKQTIALGEDAPQWTDSTDAEIVGGSSVSYYFNDKASISTRVISGDVTISANYFITNNFAIELSYGDEFYLGSNNNDDNAYGVKLTMQF